MSDLPRHPHGAGLARRDFRAVAAVYGDLVAACVRRTPLWLYLACLVPPALVLAVVFAQPYVDPSILLRDTVAVFHTFGVPERTAVYYGFVSNLGVLIWSAAASVCLFAGLLLAVRSDDRNGAVFMLISGLFTGMLLADDYFMIHETIFPYLTRLDEFYLIVFYMVLCVGYLVAFHVTILRHHGMLFFLALLFFSVSVATDVFGEISGLGVTRAPPLFWFFEDGMKLLGICAWVAFYLRAAWDLLVSARLR